MYLNVLYYENTKKDFFFCSQMAVERKPKYVLKDVFKLALNNKPRL